MVEVVTFSHAENWLRDKTVSHINKPFPKCTYAQIIDNEGLVKALVSRQDYNMLKNIQGMKEIKLPSEKGLIDWRGLIFEKQPKERNNA